MSILDDLLDDLAAEGDQLRAAVAGLDAATPGEGWHAPTPAAGWDVATQVAHLTWTDETSVKAVAAASGDEAPWDAVVRAALADPSGFVDAAAHEVAADPDLLARWDAGRAALAASLAAVPDGVRLPWFGPPMSPASMATARFMETWAHALDVYDGLGLAPEPTDRVRHVCHLGFRTRGFAYAARGLTPPEAAVRVELTLPSGAPFGLGPEDAPERVSGSAWDFARLVTQRVHRDDTDLVVDGTPADPGDTGSAAYWLTIAQAFAGPPGDGRPATTAPGDAVARSGVGR